ncbi:hypothetical protein HZS_513 [Henneguya salminicola]|nr:hypothetical protein HZS_513 [Henneguya salminicola]
MLKAGITAFQKLISFTCSSAIKSGQTLMIQKRKYRELHERILRIVQSYNLQNIIQYLKKIANNLAI